MDGWVVFRPSSKDDEEKEEEEGFKSEDDDNDFVALNMLVMQSNDWVLQASMFFSSRTIWSGVFSLRPCCATNSMAALETVSKNCWKAGGRSSGFLADIYVFGDSMPRC